MTQGGGVQKRKRGGGAAAAGAPPALMFVREGDVEHVLAECRSRCAARGCVCPPREAWQPPDLLALHTAAGAFRGRRRGLG